MRSRQVEIAAWIAEHLNRHLCRCGCGHFVQPNLHRYYRRRQKSLQFLPHHQSRGRHHGNYKGGKVLAKGYVWLLVSGKHPRRTPRGYVKRCWLVIEKKLGRHLRSGEIVHHKNHIKTDDRSRNLEVTTRREHGHHHNAGASNFRWRADVEAVQVLKLRRQGLRRAEIAARLDCSVPTVYRRLRSARL